MKDLRRFKRILKITNKILIGLLENNLLARNLKKTYRLLTLSLKFSKNLNELEKKQDLGKELAFWLNYRCSERKNKNNKKNLVLKYELTY